MASLIHKGRKPKFEVHLTIYDLNNVPLVTGVSQIKWRIPGSLHAEHHGRTSKCPIANHRVEYDYGNVIPIRIGIDKNSNLTECPLEFEVLQEFSTSSSAAISGVAGNVEKTTLGVIRINLSEYVEESEALLRDVSRRVSYNGSDRDRPLTANSTNTKGTKGHARQRSSLSMGGATIGGESFLSKSSHQTTGTTGTTDTAGTGTSTLPEESADTKPAPDVEEGVIRRYLMQESKINSTLKVGILMIQIEGDRNYVAPPLKTAPVFGGIAGLIPGGAGSLEPFEPIAGDLPPGGEAGAAAAAAASAVSPADVSIAGKSRDVYETQDMYRRALAASWASQPGEMPADECIEDIFTGGDGFRTGKNGNAAAKAAAGGRRYDRQKQQSSSGDGKSPSKKSTGSGKSPDSHSTTSEEDVLGTLHLHDIARIRQHFHNAASHFHHSDRDRDQDRDRPASSSGTTAFPAFKDPGELTLRNAQAYHFQPSQQPGGLQFLHQQHSHRRDLTLDGRDGRDGLPTGGGGGGGGNPSHLRSDSMVSLATTLGSEREKSGFKRPQEVGEFDVRDDLVAWTMPHGLVS